MVSDTANIDASKINISTLFSVINNDNTHTLKGSKIYLDAQGQVLDLAFSELTTELDATQGQVSTLETNVNVVSGKISTIISASDLQELEDGNTTFYTQYVATKQTMDSWELALANQNSTFSDLLNEVSVNSAKISATPTVIKAVVTSDYVNNLDSISAMRASITLNAEGIVNKVDKNGVIASINQSAEQVEIEANRVRIGTGTNFERGEVYTWENYVGKTWNEMIALANV
ncbi:MAG: hypothetical protein GX995_07030 [Clostridiales bacterium]|nr:hypothetical protein [Clostridiales bacterium]